MKTNVVKKQQLNPVAITVLVILNGLLIALLHLKVIPPPLFGILILVSILFASSIQIVDQWDKAVVLRMGKYKGLRGPGIFLIIPILDKISSYIDQRVRLTDFTA